MSCLVLSWISGLVFQSSYISRTVWTAEIPTCDRGHPNILVFDVWYTVNFVAGHLVFQSLLISVGLGATVMGVAATSADGVRATQRLESSGTNWKL